MLPALLLLSSTLPSQPAPPPLAIVGPITLKGDSERGWEFDFHIQNRTDRPFALVSRVDGWSVKVNARPYLLDRGDAREKLPILGPSDCTTVPARSSAVFHAVTIGHAPVEYALAGKSVIARICYDYGTHSGRISKWFPKEQGGALFFSGELTSERFQVTLVR